MFGIGMPELAVILVVALVVLGPKRLPEIARALGKGLAEFRKVTGDVNKEIQSARDMIESEARAHERTRRELERESARQARSEALASPASGSEPPPATVPASGGAASSDPAAPGEAPSTPSDPATPGSVKS